MTREERREAFLARQAEDEARWNLSDEMRADGWRVVARWLMWTHTPSKRVVYVDERASGTFVVVQVCDEWGNPISGDELGPMPLGRALRQAVIARRLILEERPIVPDHEQMRMFGGVE